MNPERAEALTPQRRGSVNVYEYAQQSIGDLQSRPHAHH